MPENPNYKLPWEYQITFQTFSDVEFLFDKFPCNACLRDKFMHTENHIDRQCPFLTEGLIMYVGPNNKYRCTKRIPHEWEYDDKGELIDPGLPVNDISPNQLTINFDHED